MKYRFFMSSIILIVTVLFNIACCANEINNNIETSNHLLYKIENGKVIITGYTGHETVLIIPDEINNCDVVCIAPLSFNTNETLWTVILPPTIQEIQEAAFQRSSIREIFLPQSLQFIGDGAFAHSNLTSIYLPASITKIGNSVFSGCLGIRSVKIDASINCIPERTFFECINLYDIDLPSEIKEIKEEAFYFCRELRLIDIPDSIIYIDETAFFDCNNLWDNPLLKNYIN